MTATQPLRGSVERACAICGASSSHAADFATLSASSWWDGTRQRDARRVLVCTRCLGGEVTGLTLMCRAVAQGVSALLGGGL